MDCVIYALKDPASLQVRYVGQSRRGLQRARDHWRPSAVARRENPHMSNWLRKLLAEGKKPLTEVIESVASPEDLDEAEIFWIAKTREMGFPMLNVLDGGDKPPVRVMSIEERAEKAKQMGALKYWKGRKFTDEHRAKLSAVHKGKAKPPRTAEHTRNNTLAQRLRCVDGSGRIYLTLKDASKAMGISYQQACDLVTEVKESVNGLTLKKLVRKDT